MTGIKNNRPRHLWGRIGSLGCGSGVQGSWEQVAVVRIRQRAVICGVQSHHGDWVGLRTVMCETSVDRGMPSVGGDIGSRALACGSG